MVARRAAPAVEPSGIGARSRTPSGTPARVSGTGAGARFASVSATFVATRGPGEIFRRLRAAEVRYQGCFPARNPHHQLLLDRSFRRNGAVAEFDRPDSDLK